MITSQYYLRKSNLLILIFSIFIMLLIHYTYLFSQSEENELIFNDEKYLLNPATGRFELKGQPISYELNRKLKILKEYKFKGERIDSINPIYISGDMYYPYFFHERDLSTPPSKDCYFGDHSILRFKLGTPNWIKGIVVLDKNCQIIQDTDTLSRIFTSFQVQYRFNCAESQSYEPTSYDFGKFDIYENRITNKMVDHINGITTSLLGQTIFVPQEVTAFVTDSLKGGFIKQRYESILKEMLIKRSSDYSTEEKKEILDALFLGKAITNDIIQIGKYSKAKNVKKISKSLEKMLEKISTVKDPSGRNKILRIGGRNVDVFWSEPLIEFVFVMAENKVYEEERINQLKSLLEISQYYPDIHFNQELISAITEVIRESELNTIEDLGNRLTDFLLTKGPEYILKYSWDMLVKQWIDFIWKAGKSGPRTAMQHALVGVPGQVALGFEVSNFLWGMDTIYESSIKAKTALELTEELQEAFSKIYLSQSKFEKAYYYSDAKHIKSLLVCLGLCRSAFFNHLANIANSSIIKTVLVDIWSSFIGQKTMSEAIEENKQASLRTEEIVERAYLNSDGIYELIELAMLRAQKQQFLEVGTGLALIIDSTGSMSNNDPHNARIYAGELVIDQAEDNWEIGIVDFDTSSKLLGSGSPKDRSLKRALTQIDSSGNTNIQIGLEEGFQFLEITSKERKVAILLTDGNHNVGNFDYSKYVDTFTQKGWPIYTIGLTGDANEVLLSKIASMTGGAYVKADSYQDMLGLIDLILSQFKLEGIIAYLKSKIKSGETAVLEFPVDNSVNNMQQRSSYPGSKIEFSLIDPQGREISATDLSQGVEVIEGKVYKIIKVKNPMPGIWKAKAVGIEVSGQEEPYEIKISADTPIRVEAKGAKPVYLPYEPIEFKVNITGDVDQSSLVSKITVKPPEGDEEKISMKKDLSIKYPKTSKPGVYYFNIEVTGKKNDGEQFMREGLKHIVVASAGKEFGVGNIIKIYGSYIEIDLGKEIGLSEGKKIFIYTISGGMKKKIAEGYVTSAFQGSSVIELTATWGSEIPKIGNRAEIDKSEF